MNKIHIEEENIIEYISDLLSDFKTKSANISNARYHHNSSYDSASSIINHGILSLNDINKLKIKEYNDDFLKTMGDNDSHINGNNGISLAVVGLQDLYRDEFEYDPFNINQVDFIITSDIKACRTTTHYGNEFISYNKIETDMIKAVDIRLIKCLENIEDKESLKKIVIKYNCLLNIASSIKEKSLDLAFREMSDNNNSTLDVDKITKSPKLILKP